MHLCFPPTIGCIAHTGVSGLLDLLYEHGSDGAQHVECADRWYVLGKSLYRDLLSSKSVLTIMSSEI
jgi:hypothetical protein